MNGAFVSRACSDPGMMTGTGRSVSRLMSGVVIAAIGVSPCAGRESSEDRLRHAGAHLLQSDVLRVEVMDPHHEERYNRGGRFSPVAAVLRVWSGTNEFLFSPVGHDPLTEHGGLPTEFDLVTPPPGFTEAAAGEAFVKIGVGALRKEGDHYRFFREYEVITPPDTHVVWGADRADFRQALDAVNGYGYFMEASVKVVGDEVRIEWSIENTGTKRLVSQHYTHNYFRFGDDPVGSAYVLRFPYAIEAASTAGVTVEGNALRLTGVPGGAVNFRVPYPGEYDGPNRCWLRHGNGGASVEIATSLPGAYTAVFATAQTFCPEQFVALDLAPGERTQWTRSYRFRGPGTTEQ